MKVAVYTAIFGDKDEIREPINYKQSDGIDYFLITDNLNIKSYAYKIIHRKPFYDDITKNARFYKIKGLDIFKNYDVLIWHDANIQMINNKIDVLVNKLDGKDFIFFRHPERNCIYEEAIKCIQLNKDYPFTILKQIYYYKKKGIDKNKNLFATGIFIQNRKQILESVLNTWWNETRLRSRRDQLSLPFALLSNNVTPNILEVDIRCNEYSVFHQHKHKSYNFLSKETPNSYNPISKKIAIVFILLLKKLYINKNL
ncbi:MAG: DUF616 domain-containing protein [Flavobacteriaceae bacterium]|nr:DUF616 domain-containing protein [Flavobacteriaceae bacterium]